MAQQFSSLDRVMEAETISKNEASPKSQMSRRNIIQKVFFLFTVLCNSIAITFAQVQDANVQNENSYVVIIIIIVAVLVLAPTIINLIQGKDIPVGAKMTWGIFKVIATIGVFILTILTFGIFRRGKDMFT